MEYGFKESTQTSCTNEWNVDLRSSTDQWNVDLRSQHRPVERGFEEPTQTTGNLVWGASTDQRNVQLKSHLALSAPVANQLRSHEADVMLG